MWLLSWWLFLLSGTCCHGSLVVSSHILTKQLLQILSWHEEVNRCRLLANRRVTLAVVATGVGAAGFHEVRHEQVVELGYALPGIQSLILLPTRAIGRLLLGGSPRVRLRGLLS